MLAIFTVERDGTRDRSRGSRERKLARIRSETLARARQISANLIEFEPV